MGNKLNKGAIVAQQLAAMQRAQAQMKSITNHQQRGSNGISWQANQQNAGNSAKSQSGNSAGNSYIVSTGARASTISTFWPSVIGWASGFGEDEKLEPLKTSGFKCGEIVAWRGWRITPQRFLRSMSADVIWAPGEPMEGKTNSRELHCGVYAYKHARDFLKEHAEHLEIYGRVALWGDVIEHELGYRAEFAKIISIEGACNPQTPNMTVVEMRKKYCAEAA